MASQIFYGHEFTWNFRGGFINFKHLNDISNVSLDNNLTNLNMFYVHSHKTNVYKLFYKNGDELTRNNDELTSIQYMSHDGFIIDVINDI